MKHKFNLKDLQSAYSGLLTEAKIDDMLEKSSISSDQKKLVRNINDRLSNKTKYLNYIIKNIDMMAEDEINDLIYFDEYQQAFPGTNIDTINTGGLSRLIYDHQMKKESEKIHYEAEKIFEDEDVLIVSPLTYEAAVYHGKGTNWCISTSNPRHWENYTGKYEKFYFFISKKYPITNRFSKVAIQILQNGNINEFRDRKDDMIKESDIDIYDFNKYKQYLKPMEITLAMITKKYNLKYNESTGLYDCEQDVVILNNSLLIKNGKFIINFGHIEGFFKCSHCTHLISLEGCPKEVDYDFGCAGCISITSLKGAPEKVGGNFNCSFCSSLTSLEGAPKEVGRNFNCSDCRSLTSLKGCPEEIKGNFDCSDCQNLISLEGCPKRVGGFFACSKNNNKTITYDEVKKHCDVNKDIYVYI